jgi:hypothetical protein
MFVYVPTKYVTSTLHAGYVVTVDKLWPKSEHKLHGYLWPMEVSTLDTLDDTDVTGNDFGKRVII